MRKFKSTTVGLVLALMLFMIIDTAYAFLTDYDKGSIEGSAGSFAVKIDEELTKAESNVLKPGEGFEYTLGLRNVGSFEGTSHVTIEMSDKRNADVVKAGLEPSLTDEIEVYYKGNKIDPSEGFEVDIYGGINTANIVFKLKENGSSELYSLSDLDIKFNVSSKLDGTLWGNEDVHETTIQYEGTYDTPIIIDPIEKKVIGKIPELNDGLKVIESFEDPKINPKDRKITSVGEEAFKDGSLEKLVVDGDIEVIKEDAFKNNKLCHVTIGDQVKEIKKGAFDDQNCSEGKSTIKYTPGEGDYVNEKGNHVIRGEEFDKDKWNFDVNIEKYTYNIGIGATEEVRFAEISGFNPEYVDYVYNGKAPQIVDDIKTHITFEGPIKIPHSYQGSAMSEDDWKMYELKEGETKTFPISSIAHNSFYGIDKASDEKITEVDLSGSNIQMIFQGAFAKNNIEKVKLNDNLLAIGRDAFYNNKIKEVNLPESLLITEHGSFAENEIEEIVFPEGMKQIDSHSFYLNKLRKIVIPDTVESMTEGDATGEVFHENSGGVVYANQLTEDKWPVLRGYQFEDKWDLRPLSEYKE